MVKTGSAWAKLVGQSGNVIIPKAFADLMGGLDGGAVLSDLVYWQDREGDWFWRTDALIADRQRISTYSAKHGRTQLIAAKLLEMKMQGQPAKAHYRLDLAAVLDRISNDPIEPLRARPPQMIGAGPSDLGGSLLLKEEVRVLPKGSVTGTNGVPVAAPLSAHTNGSTQPEPLASPALPPFAVNGASPAAGDLGDATPPFQVEGDPSPARPKRSARNGKASANGSAHAEPDESRGAESKAVFGELCEWLGLDWQRLPANTRGRLNRTAANILDAGLGLGAVEAARIEWRDDWRAKGGRAPELGLVEDLVARAAANGTRPRIDMSEVF